MTKPCSKCKQELPIGRFHKSARARSGLQSWCKSCQSDWLHENRDKRLTASRKWQAANRDRLSNRFKKFGLLPDDVAAMIDAQDGVCPICRDELDRAPQSHRTHVDHDHSTGRVRAILCFGCNVAIGHLRESPERARSLADYLEHHASTDRRAAA